MRKTISMFSYVAVRPALRAEEARRERGEHGGPLWEVKVVSARDYHRVGDQVIIEL